MLWECLLWICFLFALPLLNKSSINILLFQNRVAFPDALHPVWTLWNYCDVQEIEEISLNSAGVQLPRVRLTKPAHACSTRECVIHNAQNVPFPLWLKANIHILQPFVAWPWVCTPVCEKMTSILQHIFRFWFQNAVVTLQAIKIT